MTVRFGVNPSDSRVMMAARARSRMLPDPLRTFKPDLPEFYEGGVNPAGGFIEIAYKGEFVLSEQHFKHFGVVDVLNDLFFHGIQYIVFQLNKLAGYKIIVRA